MTQQFGAIHSPIHPTIHRFINLSLNQAFHIPNKKINSLALLSNKLSSFCSSVHQYPVYIWLSFSVTGIRGYVLLYIIQFPCVLFPNSIIICEVLRIEMNPSIYQLTCLQFTHPPTHSSIQLPIHPRHLQSSCTNALQWPSPRKLHRSRSRC